MRTVTCFVLRDGKVLLQERPAGKTWAGTLNGPGGKVQPGEAPADAVVREVREETGLRILEPEPRGSLTLWIPAPRILELGVDVFVATAFEGDVCAREGALSWHDRDVLPFARMWPDQKYWLPAVLDGCHVDGTAAYEPAGLRLSACTLQLHLPERA